MEKLDFSDIKDQQLVDIRLQQDYQMGHLKNSLNLNPKNFKKYAEAFLSFDQGIVFVAGNENTEDLDNLSKFAEEKGFSRIEGYLLVDDIPKDNLQKTDTITAEKFLNNEEDYILLDVRHPDEITRPAPEKNLANIPLEDLTNDFQTLDKNKTIYTLCGSGNRGTSAASYLSSKGFNATVIEGGMKKIQELQ